MKTTNNAFAEVIESSLSGWIAQVWHWDFFPSFGSLVIIESKNKLFFGIVSQINTGSINPMRYPFPYQKTEEDLLKEQPQIFEFLKTTFSCLMVGYQENKKIIYQIASEPPKIHAFIQPAEPIMYKLFFNQPHYLPIIFANSANTINIDELLLGILKHIKSIVSLNSDYISNFIDHFLLLTCNDYKRVKLFLSRLEMLL